MKRMSFMIGLTALLAISNTWAEVKPERGKDLVAAPAIGKTLCLHNLFQSNMVLQRDKPIPIWGWATAGENVSVTLGGKTETATAGADRSWKVTLSAMTANAKPQQITVKGKNKTLTLDNILIGDVWILSGQSNMEFPLSKIDSGKLEVVSANFDNIRILTVPSQNGAAHKKGFARLYEWSGWSNRHFRKGFWDVCSPKTVGELSAIGYVFARRIHMAAQVPIGVIDASRGGTTVETWTPDSVLRTIDDPVVKAWMAEWDKKVADFDPQKDLEDRIKRHQDWVARMKKIGQKIPANRKPPTEVRPGPADDPNRPGNCYASMLAPISGIHVKGTIWHQGFNNAFHPKGGELYYAVFPKMITAWRKAFNDPAMPFGIISLCTAGDPQDLDDYLERMIDGGIPIREVQYKTFRDLQKAGDKNIGFASSFDQRRSWYHPQIKVPVGERIAKWALATQYGMSKDIKWEPPTYKEMKVEEGKILLKMAGGRLGAYNDGPILGFAIAGEDKKFQPAQAGWLVKGKDRRNRPQYDRTTLVLTSPHVPNPIHFRYAWGRNPLANFKTADHTDIPFATQRSDSWTLADEYEAYTGKKTKVPGQLDRSERGALTKELRAADMARRVKDAEALIKQSREGKTNH